MHGKILNPKTWSINSKPLALPAMNLENLDGDYYVVDTQLDTSDTIWKEIQAGIEKHKDYQRPI